MYVTMYNYIYSLYALCRSVDLEKLIFHEKILFSILPYHKGNNIAANCGDYTIKQVSTAYLAMSILYICKKR